MENNKLFDCKSEDKAQKPAKPNKTAKEKTKKEIDKQKDKATWVTGNIKIARVALPLPVHSLYDYIIPELLVDIIQPGIRLRVPFRSRVMIGFCVEVQSVNFDEGARLLKEVIEVIDDAPIMPAELINLCRWITDYYGSPIGETFAAAIPGGIKKRNVKSKVIYVRLNIPEGQEESIIAELDEKKTTKKQSKVLRTLLTFNRDFKPSELAKKIGISMSPLTTLLKSGLIRYEAVEIQSSYKQKYSLPKNDELTLTDEQRVALDEIIKGLNSKKFITFLLQGVTSSGKTEIYLRAIEHALSQGKSALMLVPEIALTPQTIARFEQRFGELIAVWHSAMTNTERALQWRAVLEGRAKVVIGVRSAIFAPVQNLGLIIVDEEHETTYKQQNNPRYNARDVAVQRCFMHKAVVVLGSATPSIESRSNSEARKYKLLKLTKRVAEGKLPRVVLVDMRLECIAQKRYAIFSEYLENELNLRVSSGEQAILFLNRRGAHTYINCPECGFVLECSNCKVSMTYHRDIDRAVCHYCYEVALVPQRCPECGAANLRHAGIGVQEVEREIGQIFPEFQLARMDSDTMTNREAYEQTLDAFRKGEIDVLIGTQMIAKGLDFPNVTLVGVINADQMLTLPDFRASERAFQLISQVAGRAGRGEKAGLVIVQTFMPEQQTLQLALTQRYDAFFRTEIRDRKQGNYPPYSRIVQITIECPNEDEGLRFADNLRAVIVNFRLPKKIEILGPAPAILSKIRERFRHQLMIKAPDAQTVRALMTELRTTKTPRNLRLILDVDPTNFS